MQNATRTLPTSTCKASHLQRGGENSQHGSTQLASPVSSRLTSVLLRQVSPSHHSGPAWDRNNLGLVMHCTEDGFSPNFTTAKILAQPYFSFLVKPITLQRSPQNIPKCLPCCVGWSLTFSQLFSSHYPCQMNYCGTCEWLNYTAGVHHSRVTTTTVSHALPQLPFTPCMARLTSAPLKHSCPLPSRTAPSLVASNNKNCSLVQEIMCQDSECKRRNVFFLLNQLVLQAFCTTPLSAVILPQNINHATEGSEMVQ